MAATASGTCWGLKLSSAAKGVDERLNCVRRPKALMMKPRFPSIRCCSSSSSSSSFPSSIQIPDIKFHPDPSSKHDFAAKFLPVILPGADRHAKLHRLVLRMNVLDVDGELDQKLAPFKEAYDQWFNKMANNEIIFDLGLLKARETNKFIAKGISGCLLEHADSWICGYSAVLYEDFDFKFITDELLKLEPVLNLCASGRSTNIDLHSLEILILVKVYGTICDKDIHTREELLDVLQQLNTLENPNEHILEVMPFSSAGVLSKAKVDAFDKEVDKKEDYAHICLGKFQ